MAAAVAQVDPDPHLKACDLDSAQGGKARTGWKMAVEKDGERRDR